MLSRRIKYIKGKKSQKEVIYFLVTMIKRNHLYPYRTQKLSSKVPKILVGFPAGKIGRRQNFILYSSIAQLVERTAVNRDVASSSLA